MTGSRLVSPPILRVIDVNQYLIEIEVYFGLMSGTGVVQCDVSPRSGARSARTPSFASRRAFPPPCEAGGTVHSLPLAKGEARRGLTQSYRRFIGRPPLNLPLRKGET